MELNKIFHKSLRRHEHRQLITILSAVIATAAFFAVQASLSRYSEALSSEPLCGMEEHVHSDTCYDETGNLICTIPQHVHTEECFQDEVQIKEPVLSEEGTDKVENEENASDTSKQNIIETIKEALIRRIEESYDNSTEDAADDVTVVAEFDDGVLPEDVVMKVTAVDASQYEWLASQVTDTANRELRTYDISFYKGDELVEPEGDVKITFKAGFIQEKTDPQIVHFEENEWNTVEKTEVIEEMEVKDGEISVVTDSFSVYGIIYTVDFTYEVDGNTYCYSIEGNTSISLKSLLSRLNVVSEEKIDDFIGRISSVWVSDESLVQVSRQDSGDWMLESLAPFTSEEQLVITMNDGQSFTVKVTDGQSISLLDIADSTNVTIQTSSEDGRFSRDAVVEFKVSYDIADENKLEQAKQNSPWIYDLSSLANYHFLTLLNNENGVIRDGTKTVGSYVIENGIVRITINQDWLDGKTDIRGDFELSLKFDAAEIGTDEVKHIGFPDNKTVDVYFEETSVETTKTVQNSQNGNNYNIITDNEGHSHIKYLIEVKPNAAFTTLTLTDTLGVGQTLDTGSVKIYQYGIWNTPYTAAATSLGNNTFSVDVAGTLSSNNVSITANTTYYVEYTTTIDPSVSLDGTAEALTNSASWKWEAGGTDKTKDVPPTSVIPIKSTAVTKTVATTRVENGGTDINGDPYYQYTFDYTITVGDGINDLKGHTITDVIGKLQKLNNPILITDVTTGSMYSIPTDSQTGTIEGLGTYTFNTDSTSWNYQNNHNENLFSLLFDSETENKHKYTIAYHTVLETSEAGLYGASNVENQINTDDGNSDHTSVPVQFPKDDASVSKKWIDYLSEDGKTMAWEIYVNLGEGVHQLKNVDLTEYHPKWSLSDDYDYLNYEIEWVKKKDGTALTEGTDYTITDRSYEDSTIHKTVNDKVIHFDTLNSDIIVRIKTIYPGEENLSTQLFTNRAKLTVNEKWVGEPTATKQFDGQIDFSKTGVLDKATGVILWTVTINSVQKKFEPDFPLYFSDDIPSGMKVINYDGTPDINGSPQIHVSISSKANNVTDQAVTLDINTNENGDIGPIKIANNEYQTWISERYYGVSDYAYTISYKTMLTQEGAEIFAEDEDGKATFTNTAKYGDREDSILGEVSKDVEYEYLYIDKKDIGIIDGSPDSLKYQIDVNPDGLTLNEGEELILRDNLTSTNVDLDTDSIKVYYKGTSQEVDGVRISYSDDDRLIELTLPDRTPITVEYVVIAQNLGKQTFNNSAELLGKRTWSDSTSVEHDIVSHSGSITGEYSIRLVKIDKDNVTNKLEGAKFEIYRVNTDYVMPENAETITDKSSLSPITIGSEEKISEGYTNSSGELTVQNLVPYNQLYYWIEKEAPTGYILDSTKHYFVLYEPHADHEVEKKNKNKADCLDYVATNALNQVVNKTTVRSDWTVVNKVNGIGLTVNKRWLDDAGTNKALQNGDKIYFKIYQIVGDSDAVEYTYNSKTVQQIEYKASSGWTSFNAAGLPEKIGDNNCRYYVVETDSDGNPISSSDYNIQYKANTGEATDAPASATISKTGTLTIINQDKVSITATKVWVDNNNEKNKRPESITFQLYMDNQPLAGSEKTIYKPSSSNPAEPWPMAEWTGLEIGHTYKVVENNIGGYITEYEPAELTASGGITVTNTVIEEVPGTTQVSVKKKWVDDNGTLLTDDEAKDLTAEVELNLYRAQLIGDVIKVHFVKFENNTMTLDYLQPVYLSKSNPDPLTISTTELNDYKVVCSQYYEYDYDANNYKLNSDGDFYNHYQSIGVAVDKLQNLHELFVYFKNDIPNAEQVTFNYDEPIQRPGILSQTGRTAVLKGQNATAQFLNLPTEEYDDGTYYLLKYTVVEKESSDYVVEYVDYNPGYIDDAAYGEVSKEFNIKNRLIDNTSYVLPESGGSGTRLIYATGVLILLTGGILILKKGVRDP